MRFLFLVFLLCTFNSFATQIVQWNNKPVSVVLPVGKERILQFDGNVFVGVPSNIKDSLRIQPAQGYVYITALNDFGRSRLQVKIHETGEILLFDVSTTNADSTTENIIVKTQRKAVTNNKPGNEIKSPTSYKNITPAQLTQYVAKMFYAPVRLTKKDARIKMSKAPDIELSGLFGFDSYGWFDAKAVAVFKTSSMYLTAIQLNNKSNKRLPILHKHIDAVFTHATSQHLTVQPKGMQGDMTMLYLITENPLEASLYVARKGN